MGGFVFTVVADAPAVAAKDPAGGQSASSATDTLLPGHVLASTADGSLTKGENASTANNPNIAALPPQVNHFFHVLRGIALVELGGGLLVYRSHLALERGAVLLGAHYLGARYKRTRTLSLG